LLVKTSLSNKQPRTNSSIICVLCHNSMVVVLEDRQRDLLAQGRGAFDRATWDPAQSVLAQGISRRYDVTWPDCRAFLLEMSSVLNLRV